MRKFWFYWLPAYFCGANMSWQWQQNRLVVSDVASLACWCDDANYAYKTYFLSMLVFFWPVLRARKSVLVSEWPSVSVAREFLKRFGIGNGKIWTYNPDVYSILCSCSQPLASHVKAFVYIFLFFPSGWSVIDMRNYFCRTSPTSKVVELFPQLIVWKKSCSAPGIIRVLVTRLLWQMRSLSHQRCSRTALWAAVYTPSCSWVNFSCETLATLWYSCATEHSVDGVCLKSWRLMGHCTT